MKFRDSDSMSYLRISREGHQVIETRLVRLSLEVLPGGISDCGPATLRKPKVGQYLVKPQSGLVIKLAGD